MAKSQTNSASLPTDFDDDIVQQADQSLPVVQNNDSMPTKDIDGVPYCRVHHCRMKMYSGGSKDGAKAYYKCQVDGCEETGQVIKTKREQIVPAEPLACPRCSKDGKKVICERSKKLSTSSYVILECPKCLWHSNSMALPNLAEHHHRARHIKKQEPAGIGDR